MTDFAVAALAFVTIASYIWAARYHFDEQQMQIGAKIITITLFFGVTLNTLVIFRYDQPEAAKLVGLLVMTAALVLFFMAIRETRNARLRPVYTTDQPLGLVDTGPYRFIRHPFYASYIAFWGGFAIASWSLVGLFFLVVMAALYTRGALLEEKKFLQTDLADSYRAFSASRARFFPPFF